MKVRHRIPFRVIAAFAIAALEVAGVLGIMVLLCRHVPYFYLAALLTEIGCVIRIIASDDNPDYKVPWLLIVLVVPIAGFMLYFMFYSRTLKKKYIRRLQALREDTFTRDDGAAMAQLRQEQPLVYGQARMLCAMAETHLYTGTRQTYYPLGDRMLPAMLSDLRAARRFIFLEYFIIENGQLWGAILEVLKEKAAQGVEVRVLYDDIGCMTTLPGNYARTLRSLGIAALPFSRMRGNADSEFNNRSHRKLMIVDGRVGYTGGINLADEYINARVKFGHWKDVGIRLEGEAVWEMTRLFLIDFGLNAPKPPVRPADCFPTVDAGAQRGYVIPFGDGPGPIYPRRVAKTLLQSMLSCATRTVRMTTPYLIIDNDLCQSIENAALRGVDVRIIVPHIPDKRLILEMTRSFYPRLIHAGVRLYEYTPGFLHAKSVLVDDELGMVGTINLDYRSLVHHFENGVWMYRCDSLRALKEDLEDTLSRSGEVTPEQLRVGLGREILRSVVRILAPML